MTDTIKTDLPAGARAGDGIPAQPAPVDETALIDLINSHLTGFYWCGRVWEAWSVGTMSEDDFSPAEETEFASGLAADVLKLLAAAPAVSAPLPEVAAWLAARRDAERATEVYNAALIEARARDEVVGFGRISVDAEFQAMTRASNAVIALVRPMLTALDKHGIQAPVTGEQA